MVRLGTEYCDSKDYANAFAWLSKARDAGSTEGLYRLAALYENGLGTDADLYTATELYLAAEQAGDSRAADKLQDPDFKRYAKVVAEKDSFVYVPGTYGETVPFGRGHSVPICLDIPVTKCDFVKIILRVTPIQGYPYASWYLYRQDLNGDWAHVAGFTFDEKMTDGEPVTLELKLDQTESFQALALCTAEDFMSYEMNQYLEVYVAPSCVPESAQRALPPTEEQIKQLEIPKTWAHVYVSAYNLGSGGSGGGVFGGGGEPAAEMAPMDPIDAPVVPDA